jgi:hypothetical protein
MTSRIVGEQRIASKSPKLRRFGSSPFQHARTEQICESMAIFGVANLSFIHVECVSTDDTVSAFLPATTSDATTTSSLSDLRIFDPVTDRPSLQRAIEKSAVLRIGRSLAWRAYDRDSPLS